MSKTDILIIGSGLSGLFAACVAAEKGKKVKVLSYGKGSLTIGCGYIDVLGYDDDGEIIRQPIEGMKTVDADHPYAKIDGQIASDALAAFMAMAEKNNLPYIGSADKNMWIPTAIGKFKPTCLSPKTTDPTALRDSDHFLVVGIEGLKDFYADIVYKNLKTRVGDKKSLDKITVKVEALVMDNEHRDISAMDIARALETEAGYRAFIEGIRPHVKEKTALLIPPVLGVEPNYDFLHRVENDLQCRVVEVSSIPPAVNGLRLLKMLTAYAKSLGVQFVDKAKVIGSTVENGKCVAVHTKNADRERLFRADNFILATGGVYGGGLEANVGTLTEPIFNISIDVPEKQTEWSHKDLFASQKQIFSLYGVSVNDKLQPQKGETVLDNVRVIGRTLAGYDENFEKSGNGVALITAYKAVLDIVGEV